VSVARRIGWLFVVPFPTPAPITQDSGNLPGVPLPDWHVIEQSFLLGVWPGINSPTAKLTARLNSARLGALRDSSAYQRAGWGAKEDPTRLPTNSFRGKDPTPRYNDEEIKRSTRVRTVERHALRPSPSLVVLFSTTSSSTSRGPNATREGRARTRSWGSRQRGTMSAATTVYPDQTNADTVTRFIPLTTVFTYNAACSKSLLLEGATIEAFEPGYDNMLNVSLSCVPPAVISSAFVPNNNALVPTIFSLGPLTCPQSWTTVTKSTLDQSSTYAVCCPS
jgi:hypothetical protein